MGGITTSSFPSLRLCRLLRAADREVQRRLPGGGSAAQRHSPPSVRKVSGATLFLVISPRLRTTTAP